MASLTREQIIQSVRENDIHFIRLQFTDIFGTIKNISITESQLEKALDNEIMFDGSSIEGFVRIEESDQNLRPDLSTFSILPWRSQSRVARLICDVYTPAGVPFEGDPRYILRRTLAKAAELGYSMNVGPECEFFLLKTDEEGRPIMSAQDSAGYFDLGPADLGENARRDMCLALEQMGFEIEASHHEVAEGQHEIDFRYSDALTTADNVMTFKMALRSIAKSHGLFASFMPKPFYGVNGSGMHTNMSLSNIADGSNAFSDPDDRLGLSKVAYSFITGLMKHARSLSLITNPLVNSYKRLVPGYEAPVYISWSAQNRSALIRVPHTTPQATRIEMRNPDLGCNPYLSFSCILAAGLDGVVNELTPPPETRNNIFDMTPAEREAAGIASLPPNLEDAM
ncbi:MAG: type I glutamate--ammonia ligase, partial [Clostridiales bacterium]|nr:type I glutamate--ammonia ligase [Clostridiales bacterium]